MRQLTDITFPGLDTETDIIIEIAVIITNGNLDPVDEGVEYVIKTDKAILDK
jgi:oligoribonuclease